MLSEVCIVCGGCERCAPIGQPRCAECGASLALVRPRGASSGPPVEWEIPEEPDTFVTQALSESSPSARAAPVDRGPRRPMPSLDWEVPAAEMKLTVTQLIAQAKSFVCRSCATPVPLDADFCPRCGTAVPPEIRGARTQLTEHHQTPGEARLVLIRGGVAGAVYQVDAEHRLVGRHGDLLFPHDSPARLVYRNGVLVARPGGSPDGIFVRVRGAVAIAPGGEFMAGDQKLRLEASDGSTPEEHFHITRIDGGGGAKLVFRARAATVKIGREGADLNLPDDPHVSASHCKVIAGEGVFELSDLNSRNGTYVRLAGERELADGDYLFLGKKLLRVEITPT
jgi:hypothetical protein